MFLKISVRAAALLPFVRGPKENIEMCILGFLKIPVRAAALLPFVRGPKGNIEICISGFLKISGAAAALPNGKYLYSISYNT